MDHEDKIEEEVKQEQESKEEESKDDEKEDESDDADRSNAQVTQNNDDICENYETTEVRSSTNSQPGRKLVPQEGL